MNHIPSGPIKTNPQDDHKANAINKNKPYGPPLNAKKNFSKVLAATKKDHREEEEEVIPEQEKDNPLSLFASLNKKKTTLKEDSQNSEDFDSEKLSADEIMAKKRKFEIPSTNPKDDLMLADAEQASIEQAEANKELSDQMQTNAALSANEKGEEAVQDQMVNSKAIKDQNKLSSTRSAELVASNKKLNASQDALQTDATAYASKKEKILRSNLTGAEFAHDHPDLAQINPIAQAVNADNKDLEGKKTVVSRIEMQNLLKQIVEGMQVIQKEGLTETTLDLKFPPLFAGAQLTLINSKENPTAFSIAFSNLRQEAQIALKNTKDAFEEGLKLSLGNEYSINAFTTSLKPADAQTQNETSYRFAREQREQQQGQKKQNKEENA
ncbi:MAG: hypothetical protein H0W88_00670 [Parachlamydiaceae bacterium]|nr:hypothetical protein [Parachlamydiaceae bacterium]